jgi:hypothetical protein
MHEKSIISEEVKDQPLNTLEENWDLIPTKVDLASPIEIEKL